MNRISEYFHREYRKLVNYVRHRIADAADRDAEDVVMDVILNIFDKADISAPIDNLSAYIYQALRNRITDLFRSRRDLTSLKEIVQESKEDTVNLLEQKQVHEDLYNALDDLSDDQRAVLIATEFEGRPFKELAEDWQVPIGTLLARKSRALQKIKQILTGRI